jgi:hypothetical protein
MPLGALRRVVLRRHPRDPREGPQALLHPEDLRTGPARPRALTARAGFQVHPVQISQWKKQLLDGAESLFGDGRRCEHDESLALQAELYEQIGRLNILFSAHLAPFFSEFPLPSAAGSHRLATDRKKVIISDRWSSHEWIDERPFSGRTAEEISGR